jgi:60 kDa SS-A/Ro ribonucleoprotein
MVNKTLFASMLGRLPKANAVNEAGGLAYKLEPKHALAQVAATGTFGNAFYARLRRSLTKS